MTATTHLGRSGSAGKWPEWAETGGRAMRRGRPIAPIPAVRGAAIEPLESTQPGHF